MVAHPALPSVRPGTPTALCCSRRERHQQVAQLTESAHQVQTFIVGAGRGSAVKGRAGQGRAVLGRAGQ